jgi:hypothetical protein
LKAIVWRAIRLKLGGTVFAQILPKPVKASAMRNLGFIIDQNQL